MKNLFYFTIIFYSICSLSCSDDRISKSEEVTYELKLGKFAVTDPCYENNYSIVYTDFASLVDAPFGSDLKFSKVEVKDVIFKYTFTSSDSYQPSGVITEYNFLNDSAIFTLADQQEYSDLELSIWQGFVQEILIEDLDSSANLMMKFCIPTDELDKVVDGNWELRVVVELDYNYEDV